jgi:hypothetical protein
MPPANITELPEEDRRAIRRWYRQADETPRPVEETGEIVIGQGS